MSSFRYEDQNFLDSELLGIKMGNLMLTASLICVMVFLVSLCWSYCAEGDETTPASKYHTGQCVMAHEIQPGFVLLEGRNGDFRILQEYNALRYHSVPMQQNSCEDYHPAAPMCTSVQCQPEPSAPLQTREGHLIDFENERRPPPYKS